MVGLRLTKLDSQNKHPPTQGQRTPPSQPCDSPRNSMLRLRTCITTTEPSCLIATTSLLVNNGKPAIRRPCWKAILPTRSGIKARSKHTTRLNDIYLGSGEQRNLLHLAAVKVAGVAETNSTGWLEWLEPTPKMGFDHFFCLCHRRILL